MLTPCEKFNTNYKKKTKQRASLPNTSMELEKSWSMAVVQDAARDVVINNLYPSLGIGSKIKEFDCGYKVVPFNCV